MPGDKFTIEHEYRFYEVVVPAGAEPGETITIKLPQKNTGTTTPTSTSSTPLAFAVSTPISSPPEEAIADSTTAKKSIALTLECEIPAECVPGSKFFVEHEGRYYEVVVPPGGSAGQTVIIYPTGDGHSGSDGVEAQLRALKAMLAELCYPRSGTSGGGAPRNLCAELDELKGQISASASAHAGAGAGTAMQPIDLEASLGAIKALLAEQSTILTSLMLKEANKHDKHDKDGKDEHGSRLRAPPSEVAVLGSVLYLLLQFLAGGLGAVAVGIGALDRAPSDPAASAFSADAFFESSLAPFLQENVPRAAPYLLPSLAAAMPALNAVMPLAQQSLARLLNEECTKKIAILFLLYCCAYFTALASHQFLPNHAVGLVVFLSATVMVAIL